MNYKKYKPYIRKANGKERAASFSVALQLALYQDEYGKDFYVMVQHGFPNRVVAVGKSKEDIKDGILFVGLGLMTFNEWTKEFKRRNQDADRRK